MSGGGSVVVAAVVAAIVGVVTVTTVCGVGFGFAVVVVVAAVVPYARPYWNWPLHGNQTGFVVGAGNGTSARVPSAVSMNRCQTSAGNGTRGLNDT